MGLMTLNLAFQAVNKILEVQYGISIVQWSFLKILSKMPTVSPLALAKALTVTPGTLTQTIARLEKKKFIFVCHDPKDARKKMISLTRSGKLALDSIENNFKVIFSNIQFVDSELSVLHDFLKNVRARLDLI